MLPFGRVTTSSALLVRGPPKNLKILDRLAGGGGGAVFIMLTGSGALPASNSLELLFSLSIPPFNLSKAASPALPVYHMQHRGS